LTHTEHYDDPVAAYDRLAPYYSALSDRREAYLRSIEDLIASRIPAGSVSLLDVGAGDGTRAFRIAQACGIKRVVLLEPSSQMAAAISDHAEVWKIRAQELNSCKREEQFDVVTCLWNVLGHIRTKADRERALSGIADCMSPHGTCFLDVNHRYNARAYGVVPTLARFLKDRIFLSETAGDVSPKWQCDEMTISTHGHFFTQGEVREFAARAGLQIEDRIVVDYETGAVRRFGYEGNLLYILRRTSRIESSNALQTS